MIEKKEKNKYTDTMFYDIFLTGKYIKKMAEQLFKKMNFELTSEEFSTLDFLYEEEGICQRDLALKMLIDRANMGKILGGLEAKGFVVRNSSMKGNYPVKTVKLTKLGMENYIKIVNELRCFASRVSEKIPIDEVKLMRGKLQNIRQILKEILEIDI